MKSRTFSIAGYSSYISAFSTLFLLIFFIGYLFFNQPLGKTFDILIMVQISFMVPVAVALYQLGKTKYPRWSLRTFILALIFIAIILIAKILYLAGIISFFKHYMLVSFGFGWLGLIISVASHPDYSGKFLSARVGWFGAILGFTLVLANIWILQFGPSPRVNEFAQEIKDVLHHDPFNLYVFMYPLFIGTLSWFLGYPILAFLLGTSLLKRANESQNNQAL